jgi:hypothetical protein
MANRHERRKTAVFERKMIPPTQLTGRICAWRDCEARFAGDMPAGWTNLILYWAPRPILNAADIPARDWLRDAVLCPEHTRLLDSQLKELGREVSGPVAGSA